MPRPFISVVIPHLNQPEHLDKCLTALSNQSYPSDLFEVVVVDNGSKIPPTDIVNKYANVRLEHESLAGPGPARNRGVRCSKGEFLAFVDADCIADANWLTAIERSLAEYKIVGGDVRVGCSDPKRMKLIEAYETVFAYRQEEYIEKHGYSGTGNLAVRRSDFVQIGEFAGIDMAEDHAWGQLARTHGFRTQFVPEMIVYHPARSNFGELFSKWRRHILHARGLVKPGLWHRLAWCARAMAILLSPLVDIRRVLFSSRLPPSAGNWLKAIVALIYVRSFRATYMFAVVAGGSLTRRVCWNEPSS